MASQLGRDRFTRLNRYNVVKRLWDVRNGVFIRDVDMLGGAYWKVQRQFREDRNKALNILNGIDAVLTNIWREKKRKQTRIIMRMWNIFALLLIGGAIASTMM
jgi:hypothetical protein